MSQRQLDAHGNLSYLPLRHFCRPLHEMMQLRHLLGLRSPINTLATHAQPTARRARQSSRVFSIPAYAALHQDADQVTGTSQPRPFFAATAARWKFAPRRTPGCRCCFAGESRGNCIVARSTSPDAPSAPSICPRRGGSPRTLAGQRGSDNYGEATVTGNHGCRPVGTRCPPPISRVRWTRGIDNCGVSRDTDEARLMPLSRVEPSQVRGACSRIRSSASSGMLVPYEHAGPRRCTPRRLWATACARNSASGTTVMHWTTSCSGPEDRQTPVADQPTSRSPVKRYRQLMPELLRDRLKVRPAVTEGTSCSKWNS